MSFIGFTKRGCTDMGNSAVILVRFNPDDEFLPSLPSLPSFTGFYQVLPGLIEFYWVLLDFIGFY